MKSLLALTLALSFSILSIPTVSFAQTESFAQEEFLDESVEASRGEQWTCQATGRIATGGPGGGLYNTVWGRGSTMQIAASNALDTCYRQMQQCMIGSCSKH